MYYFVHVLLHKLLPKIYKTKNMILFIICVPFIFFFSHQVAFYPFGIHIYLSRSLLSKTTMIFQISFLVFYYLSFLFHPCMNIIKNRRVPNYVTACTRLWKFSFLDSVLFKDESTNLLVFKCPFRWYKICSSHV